MRSFSGSRHAAVALTAAFVLTACPDGADGPGDGGDGPVAWDADRFADAYIGWTERCIDTIYDPGFFAEMEPTYVSNVFDFPRLRDSFENLVENTYESPNVELNQAAYEACLAAFEDTSTPCSEEPPEDCQNVLEGQLEEGEVCANTAECAGDSSCWGSDENTCGECTPRAAGGESCEEANCTNGFECDFSGATPVCVAEEEPVTADAGDTCNPEADDPCGSVTYTGLFCLDEDDSGMGECTALEIIELGGACFRFGLDDPRYCVDSFFGDNYCDQDVMNVAEPGNCVERPGIGGDCGQFTPCKTSEAYCDDGTCVAVRNVGQSCDPTLGLLNNPCERGSSCIDGVCEAVQFNDENFPMCAETDGGS